MARNIISNVNIKGARVGIAGDLSNTAVENVTFDNVERPFDVTGEDFSISGARLVNSPTAPATSTHATGSSYRLKSRDRPPGVPARCNSCGNIFPSSRYTIMNARMFRSAANQEVCPKCGSYDAWLSEGILNIIDGVAELIEASHENREIFAAFELARTQLNSGSELDIEALLSAITKVRPNTSLNKKGGLTWQNAAIIIGLFFAGHQSLAVEMKGEGPIRPLVYSLTETACEIFDYIRNRPVSDINEEADSEQVQHPRDIPDNGRRPNWPKLTDV